MTVTIDGTTGIVVPAFDGTVDAADLTGTLPALNGAALTNLSAANLTGNLPAINGSALTNLPAPTTEQVGSATAGLGYGAVGTYGLFASSTFVQRSPGTTVSGSSLLPANTYESGTSYGGYSGIGTPSGTWRIMGNSGWYNGTTSGTQANVCASVYLRIA